MFERCFSFDVFSNLFIFSNMFSNISESTSFIIQEFWKVLQLLLKQLFLVQKARTRGSFPGSLPTWGVFFKHFQKAFLGGEISVSDPIVIANWLQNWPGTRRKLFLHFSRILDFEQHSYGFSIFLRFHLPQKAPETIQKHDSETTQETTQQKSEPEIDPKTWVYFGGERLGTLLAHLWRSSSFFNTKSVAQKLQKWAQGNKSDPKRLPE